MTTHAVDSIGAQISEALRLISGPVFAAAWEEKTRGKQLIVHVAAVPRRSQLKSSIVEALRPLGVVRAKVRFHRASSLLAPRSLERFVARFAGADIVYDPTGSLTRAKALVGASLAVRRALVERICGLYYAPRLRTFYVALEAARVGNGDRFKVVDLANIERAVVTALQGAFSPNLAECPAVRIGFGLPAAQLVPVDQRSVVRLASAVARALKRYWKPITLAALFGLGATSGAAAKGPAVSDPNLKITGAAGETVDQTSWQVQGAFTAPIGEFTGVQLEGGAGGVDNDEFYGVAGHLFTRDPDEYLIGLFAAYASADDYDFDITRVGAELELYLPQISIIATAGYQFSETLGDGAFGGLDLRWYITDNFYIQGGGLFDEESAVGKFVAEWQPGFAALPGLAFNVTGIIGEDDFKSVMGGITYYFGAPASLKDRHRKQDPDSALASMFQAVQEERAKLCVLYGNCQA